MLKNSIILLLIVNIHSLNAQVSEKNESITEIIAENFRVYEKATAIGLQGKVKTVKTIFQEIKTDNNIVSKSPINGNLIGYIENYNEKGSPSTYYQYQSFDQFNNKDFTAKDSEKNLIIFNKKNILEKHIHTQDGITELYDKNGNLIISENKYSNSNVNDSIKTNNKIIDYNIRKYKYNKSEKIIEQIDYETTFDKKVLNVYVTTRNKYNPVGKIIESEVIEELNKNSKIKNKTFYKYYPDNRIKSISNPLFETNTSFKYIKPNIQTITTKVKTEIKVTELIGKRFKSIKVTQDGKEMTNIDFQYTDDLTGNWILQKITIVSIDSDNKKSENKFEFVREIEYY